jgi:hypothetical protein
MDTKAPDRNEQRRDYHVPDYAKRPLFLSLPLQVISVALSRSKINVPPELETLHEKSSSFGQGLRDRPFIIRRS